MPRPFLILTVILAAFGVGFGARNVIEMRSGAPTPIVDETGSDEVLGSIGQPTLVDAPVPPKPVPTSPEAPLAPSNPPARHSHAVPAHHPAPPPSAGLGQLAYAPVVPDVPEPFVGLTPYRSAPTSSAPAAPMPPVAVNPEPNPPKLAPFSSADVDSVRDVISQMRKGDVTAADAAIRKMTDPVAKTLGEWTLMRSGLRTVPFARIQAFLDRAPDWPTQPLLQRRAEEALAAEMKPAAAVRAFFASRKPQTVVGRVALARALMADKQRDEAFAIIRTVWREDAFSDETEARLVAEFAEGLRKEDHRARMERHIFREEMAKALRSAQRAGADYASLVKLRQAVENKSANAKALLDAVPKGLRDDSSYLFARAQHLRRTEKPLEAVKALEGAPRDPDILVDGDEWWVERRMIVRKLLDLGEQKLAYKVASEHGAESDAMRVEAEFHAGWIALRFLNDPKAAATHFEKAAEAAKMPMSTSRVGYWRGRAAEAAGDAKAAQDFYTSAAVHGGFFYGQLARAKLPANDAAFSAPEPAPPDRDALAKDPALRAVDLLLTLNERDLAMSVIADLAQRSGSEAQLDALGELLEARRDARAVLVLGKLAMQRGVALHRHAFPTFGIPDYQPLATLSEPAIVHSIARQESAFNPKAVSHAGARGLMQLMPATARLTANRYKTPFDHGKLTEDPSYNTQIGAAHLSDLLEEWRGSYILVFAAYNAGSGNVKKWIDAYGDPRSPGVDPVDWIERIPFTETRNYVQRIVENLQVYRSRLSPGAPLMIEADLGRGGRRSVADSEDKALLDHPAVTTR